MVKSSSKKHFKKDIPILKIQGHSKYCNQHGDSNCENYYLFGPICTNKKFYKNLIFKKHRVSCHNLGKRNQTGYLTLQEDTSGPKYGNQLQASPPPQKKGKLSSLL